MKDTNFYRFPSIKRFMDETYHIVETTETSSIEQIDKIAEELREFMQEQGGNRSQIMECLDIIHACETWLRQHVPDNEIDSFVDDVIQKNWERGYYDSLAV